MNRFVISTVIGRALLAVGFSTAALADQNSPNRSSQLARPWPEAVVIIKSRPVREPEAAQPNDAFVIIGRPPVGEPAATQANDEIVVSKSQPVGEPETTQDDIVYRPPIFAERNSLNGPKPIFSPDQAATDKRASHKQKIARTTALKKARADVRRSSRSRRRSSTSWMNKAWEVQN